MRYNFENKNIVDKKYSYCDFSGVSFKNSTLVRVEFYKCTFGIRRFKGNLIIFLSLFSALSAGMFPTFQIFIIENIINSFNINYINGLQKKDTFILLSIINSIIIIILTYGIIKRKIIPYIYRITAIVILGFFISIVLHSIEILPYIIDTSRSVGISKIIGSILILFSFTVSLILIMSIIISISGAIAISIGTPPEYLNKSNNFSLIGFSTAALSGLGSLLGAVIGSLAIIVDGNSSQTIYDIIFIIISSVSSAFLFTIMMVIFGRQIFKLEHNELSSLRKIIISISSYFGTNFSYAKIINCDFYKSDIKNTKFYKSSLKKTSFKHTKNLKLSDLRGTILDNKTVRDLIVMGTAEYINLSYHDLTGANLNGYILKNVNMKGAILNSASFTRANIEGSNLTQVHAINTDFSYAKMTGICIDNWNIDHTTNLSNAKIDYVYIRKGERRPLTGNYYSGDFEKLFKEIYHTIDFLFRNGIDWFAFLSTYKKIKILLHEGKYNNILPDKVKNNIPLEELEIKKIENRGDNIFIVRVAIPTYSNKEKIYDKFNDIYEKMESLFLKQNKDQFKLENSTNLESLIVNITNNSGNIDMSSKNVVNKIKITGNQNPFAIGSNNSVVNKNIKSEREENKIDEIILKLNELRKAIDNSNELGESPKEKVLNKINDLSNDIENNNMIDIKVYQSFFDHVVSLLSSSSTVAKNITDTMLSITNLIDF